MIQLPFYIRNVEQGVVAGFACGTLLVLATILADQGVKWVRGPVDLFLAWRMAKIEESKRFRIFKVTMYVLSGIFLAIGTFYLLVLVGALVNGAAPTPPTVEEFRRLMQERGGR